LVVYVIFAAYAKFWFVAFGVFCGVCFCGTVGAGLGASEGFGRVSKLQELWHFSGRGVCGRTLTLSYPIIMVSGRVVDSNVSVRGPDSCRFFNVSYLMRLKLV